MSWQQQILDKPDFRIRQMLLVADPDKILNEPMIRQGLLSMGWEVIEYRDPVVFRLLYENKYRNLRDAKVIVRIDGADLKVLPYDVWKAGHKVELSLQRIFPKLSYGVLKLVDSELLAKVYSEYQAYDGELLGEQGTKDFILERVYDLYPRTLRSATALFAALLQLHYRGYVLPTLLAERFVSNLALPHKEIPVKEFLESREAFFRFLQDQWVHYVQGNNNRVVPFNEDLIRVYVDSLFLEGILQPVKAGITNLPSWTQVGVVESSPSRKQYDLAMEKLGESVKIAENHKHWQTVGRLLAESIYWAHKLDLATTDLDELRCAAEEKFLAWLQSNYGGLHSLSYHNGPVMVHHIPWFLSSERNRGRKKVALFVLDGMAMDQWLVVKESLKDFSGFINESACYAWIPTTTAISRQAMFAGEIPLNISEYLNNTSREDKLWRMFWNNQQLSKYNVHYKKALGQGNLDNDIDELTDARIQVSGLIVDTVDKLAHGEILGGKGFHSRLRIWLREGYVIGLIDRLTDQGFHVYITSDHGNVAAIGRGNPREGVLVENAGERVRIYSSQELQDQGEQKIDSVRWSAVGLPEEMHILLAKGKTAFVQEGKTVIGHGGASITEVIVPFIHLWKED